jgi:hypothetical protein
MPELVQLNKGSKEHLIVDVADRLGALTSLEPTNPIFDIRKRNESEWVSQGTQATPLGMTAYCLIDTTLSGFDVPDVYELFLQFDNVPETPRLGPMRFEVNF